MNSLNPYAASTSGPANFMSGLQKMLMTPPQGAPGQQRFPGNSAFGRAGGNGQGSLMRQGMPGQGPYTLPWMPAGQPGQPRPQQQPQPQRMGVGGGGQQMRALNPYMR